MEFFSTSNGQSESHGQEFNMLFSGGSPICNTSYGESQSNERDSHSVYTAAAELNKSTDYGLPSLAAFSAFSFQDDPKPIDQTQFSSMLDHLNQNELDLDRDESAPYYPAPKTSSPFSESLDSTSSQSTPDSLSQSVLYLENQLQHAKNPSTNVPSTTYSYMNMTPSESLYSQSTTLGQAWAQTFAQTWPQEQSQTWTHPLSHQPQTHSYSSPPTYTSGNSSTWSAQGEIWPAGFHANSFQDSSQGIQSQSCQDLALSGNLSAATLAATSEQNQKRSRSEKKPVPDEKKDEKYHERRKRNNEAAKKSRDTKKSKEEANQTRHAQLEAENRLLLSEAWVLIERLSTLEAEMHLASSKQNYQVV